MLAMTWMTYLFVSVLWKCTCAITDADGITTESTIGDATSVFSGSTTKGATSSPSGSVARGTTSSPYGSTARRATSSREIVVIFAADNNILELYTGKKFSIILVNILHFSYCNTYYNSEFVCIL
jgi:hypothetical protein